MGVLRQRKWNNAAQDDLTVIDKSLSAKIAEMDTLEMKILDANTNIKKCHDGGMFYNCKNKTGKSMKVWVNYRDNWRTRVARLKEEIAVLKKRRVDAVERRKQELLLEGNSAEVAEQVAEQESAESAASAGSAKAIGLWVGVGLAVIAGGALIYYKIIKK